MVHTPAGIYLHVPFCRRKCDYCNFYSIPETHRIPELVAGIETEIALRAEPGLPVDTVYFGGGTPSLLPPESVERILGGLAGAFDILPGAECSLEVNPGTVDAYNLAGFRGAGINRLTIGIQSFSDDVLRFLGRIHTGGQALRTVAEARKTGFSNIGLDLIFGIPGQVEAAWRGDLEQAVALSPEHLSCYQLTYEEGTALDRARRAGRFEPLTDDAMARLFETTREVLSEAGFHHYEVSNFARSPELFSRHNMKYWTFAPYLGFGPSAHSYRHPDRFWNLPDIEGYLSALSEGRTPATGRERLDRDQQMIEFLFLGMRMTTGIDIRQFEYRFGVRFTERFEPVLQALGEEDWIRMEGGRCRPTFRGMAYADGISRRLIDCL
ncbi:MAG: radical SAM family heme chaperone HemW [Desulfobacterales bacterium]